MFTNVDITPVIMTPINIFMGWLNDYSFTIFGISMSFHSWFYMCAMFGTLIFFLNWLAGGGLIKIGRIKGAIGD